MSTFTKVETALQLSKIQVNDLFSIQGQPPELYRALFEKELKLYAELLQGLNKGTVYAFPVYLEVNKMEYLQ
jgi:hypothetical protein